MHYTSVDMFAASEGTASGTPASILVDSGASHSFIDTEFAQTHGFAHRPSKSLVTLADGQTDSTTTKCNVWIRI
jgi:predicted aspartyl protease